MDSTLFHNSLLAVLIGSFLIFFVCVLCIGAASDRGFCCHENDGHSHHHSHQEAAASSSVQCACEKNGKTHPVHDRIEEEDDGEDTPPRLDSGRLLPFWTLSLDNSYDNIMISSCPVGQKRVK